MTTLFENKSTVEEIRNRFDQDVERFSKLETGQQAVMDAPLLLDLVAEASATHLKTGNNLLDLGCGAGNFTLRVTKEIGPMQCHLVDLSQPMLDRAQQRLAAAQAGQVKAYRSDLRDLNFAPNTFHAILAGAVLHHLRDEEDWKTVLQKLHGWLAPHGRLYVSDLVTFDDPKLQSLMWQRYESYLKALGGLAYKDRVVEWIDLEDTPRSLSFQLNLMKAVGFSECEVLHRNGVFACFYGRK